MCESARRSGTENEGFQNVAGRSTQENQKPKQKQFFYAQCLYHVKNITYRLHIGKHHLSITYR